MKTKIHGFIYFVGLLIIAFFLPLSEYISNAAIFLLLTNWLLEFNFKEKIKRINDDKSVLIFLLLIIVHFVWLLNTSNIDYAFKDIRIKLSLLALPIIVASSEKLSTKQLNLIFYVFISGVFISTICGILFNYLKLHSLQLSNVRNFSVFISHIRLSLMISLSIMIIFYFLSHKVYFEKALYKILMIILLLWFFAFLILIQGFTGLSALLVAGFFIFIIKAIYEKNKIKRRIYLITVALIPLFLFTFIGIQVRNFYKPTAKNELLDYTLSGNPYFHVKEPRMLENGNPVYINICEKELRWAWSKRSNLSLDEKDGKDQPLLHTLIRYLASKGLNKDAEGVFALDDNDIMNIENGYTNYKFVGRSNVKQRIYYIIWQIDYYVKGGNPSGHSVTQRFEYTKYGLILAYRNFWIGTGTGDINDEFQSLYIEKISQLEPQYRHRTHNQYLSFLISFGIWGFLAIMLAILFPIFKKLDNLNWIMASFFIIIFFSMLTDDTLETTTGALFFSYFYSIFIWGYNPKREKL